MLTAISLLKAAAGIDKIRITGGEPLLSAGFDELLMQVMGMGFDDVSFTTNGQFVLDKLQSIIDSGIQRINLSLDTLNPLRFRKIARGGDLKTVLAGLDALLDAGLLVKINMVPIRGDNHGEVLSMLQFCLQAGAELRYIELMRMGHLAYSADFNRQFFSMGSILDAIATRYEFSQIQSDYDSTAQRFVIPGQGVFGIIANESQPFCRHCTRLRLASNGQLFGCLSNAKHYDIRPLLTLPFEQAAARLEPILRSALDDKQPSFFVGEATPMKFIGG